MEPELHLITYRLIAERAEMEDRIRLLQEEIKNMPTNPELEASLERTNAVVNDLTVKVADLEFELNELKFRLFPLEFADEHPNAAFAYKFFAQERASGSAWPEEFERDIKKDYALD